MWAAIVLPSGQIAVREVPDPVPGPAEVVIDVEASGVGLVDVMARRGEYAPFPGPGFATGMEVAGTITAVGSGVPPSELGKRVFTLTPFGGHAQRVKATADRTLRVPPHCSPVDVVGAGLNALVADVVLHRTCTSGADKVLVRGAGGGIGVHATQIARAVGAEVTGITSSKQRGERLKALGATHVIDRSRNESPQGVFDVIIDTVAGAGAAAHLDLLNDNGRYVVCGAADGPPQQGLFDALLRNFHSSPTLLAFSFNAVSVEEMRASWLRLVTRLDDGSLSSVIDRLFPLRHAAEALGYVESENPFGKVVLER